MEKSRPNNHAENHPAIQRLRQHLREYEEQGGNKHDYARNLDMHYNTLTRYLRGESAPRRKTVEAWAKSLGVTIEEMMTAPDEFISYPFDKLCKPKRGGKYLSKESVRREYRDGLLNDYNLLVQEGIAEYNTEIVKILEKNRI